MKKKSTSKSAFFKLRILVAVLLGFAAITIVLFALGKASARTDSGGPPPTFRAEYRGVLPVVKFDISPPLRDMKPIPVTDCPKREHEEEGPIPLGPVGPVVLDKVVQRVLGKIEIPNPIVTFDGHDNLCGCYPPDPNGEVGRNHVFETSNVHFRIFNKQGVSLFGPVANQTLWQGFGGPCETGSFTDPVLLYDQIADRWLLSQFNQNGPPFRECIALSQTSDPLGSYYRWEFAPGNGNNLPDYPKAGMWPDAYYFSTREFAGGATFVGVGAYALDRCQALAGNPNPTIVSFLAPPNPAYIVGDGLLPSDLDGFTLPPAGSPNYFVGSEDNNGPYGAPADALSLWKFHYDPMTPGNSTFMLTNTLPTTPFNSILALCGGTRNCIPQPGTTVRLDHQGYRQRTLFRFAYRNFGDHESLVTNQSVSAGTGPNGEVSGIRWYELRSPNNNPVIFQQGTYAPGLTDGIHRWMGSIAMNSLGDIALGFSASNGTNPSVFPSVYYTGRHAGDPPGQMTLGEASIVNGTGSQTGTANRWGDYTDITIDPVNDQDFWHVNEYIPVTGTVAWRTRVGAFNVSGTTPTPSATPTASPVCGPAGSPTPTATITPSTPTPTPSPSCSPGYTTATATGTITPGGTDIGNHCDDCFTQVNLPFPVNVYGAPQSVAYAGSNGDLQLIATPGDKLFYWQECVPVTPDQGGPFNNTLFPYYDDLRTDETGVCADCGIFTQTLGTAPNRQFVIRWKTTYFNHPGEGTAEFQVVLTEGSGTLSAIYGTTVNQGAEATSGIQQNENVFTSFSCFESTLTSGLRVNYIPTGCGTPTPTPTAAGTATPTATATATAHSPTPTATATATAHSPTPTATASVTVPPRPTPTPRPRPTPPPRP